MKGPLTEDGCWKEPGIVILSLLLDTEALALFAVITHLEKNSQSWENVAVAVYFIQETDKELPALASYLTRIEAPHYSTFE